jgi:hypothetical protein
MLMAARMASRCCSHAASQFYRLSTSPFGFIERRCPSLRCEVPTVTLPNVRLVRWRSPSRPGQLFGLLVFALLFAITLQTRRTTAGLRWPLDIDLYRDIVQATSVRNGHLFADANYAGETAWYNPLLGWIVAIGSIVTRQSVATFATQGGGLSESRLAAWADVRCPSLVRSQGRRPVACMHDISAVRELAVVGGDDFFAVALHCQLRTGSLLVCGGSRARHVRATVTRSSRAARCVARHHGAHAHGSGDSARSTDRDICALVSSSRSDGNAGSRPICRNRSDRCVGCVFAVLDAGRASLSAEGPQSGAVWVGVGPDHAALAPRIPRAFRRPLAVRPSRAWVADVDQTPNGPPARTEDCCSRRMDSVVGVRVRRVDVPGDSSTGRCTRAEPGAVVSLVAVPQPGALCVVWSRGRSGSGQGSAADASCERKRGSRWGRGADRGRRVGSIVAGSPRPSRRRPGRTADGAVVRRLSGEHMDRGEHHKHRHDRVRRVRPRRVDRRRPLRSALVGSERTVLEPVC